MLLLFRCVFVCVGACVYGNAVYMRWSVLYQKISVCTAFPYFILVKMLPVQFTV